MPESTRGGAGSRDLIVSESLLLLTAAIWGFAFVFQRTAMDHIGPFTFNAIRFAIGAAVMYALMRFRRRRSESDAPPAAPRASLAPDTPEAPPALSPRTMLISGLAAGLLTFGGAGFQQAGLVHTTAGNAGFITGLYIVLVPILGIFWRHRPGALVWVGAVLAVVGLYLLSATERLTLGLGDTLVLAGAFFWAGHVVLAAWITKRMSILRLAFIQFATCSALSFAVAFAVETFVFSKILDAGVSILYGGFISVGVAYTLQLVGQRRTPPAHAAIIMGQEAVFAALGGYLFLSEHLTPRALLGCALMFAGAVLAQLRRRRG